MNQPNPGQVGAQRRVKVSDISPLSIRVLGCSGGIVAGQHTTAFLIDDDVLVDAGTGLTTLTLDEMQGIDHVFLSHAHLDHTLCLPLLLDAVGPLRSKPIEVHALPETLAVLRQHMFNGHIWPDFSVLPKACPYMKLTPMTTGSTAVAGGKHFEALPARHSVPTVGFAVSRQSGAPCWVFSGDTGPNDAFWERINALHVGMLVIETSFSDDEASLASISGHMSPAMLAAGLAQISPHQSFPICISHIKPSEADKVVAEIEHANHGLKRPLDVRRLTTGQRLRV